MSAKPNVVHPLLWQNELGLRPRDYEGAMSTLCAGCGHDSITASLIQALFELAIPPHRLVKLSGIGCSSKTTAYFAGAAHGLNAVHGRMPSIATGAHAANRELYCVGISGDGDSLSIGLGQFVHAARRNLHMLYVLENNGVYGLTKGQFSASADVGSRLKSGEENRYQPVDPVLLAISIGATFVARSFSGDKRQLVPLLKAALLHSGFAFVDVISPCVSFNDHESSTKGYVSTRENIHEVIHMDFVPKAREITADYGADAVQTVRLHDGSSLVLKKTADAYDATDPIKAHSYIREHQLKGQVVTGLLYINEAATDFHQRSETTEVPLVNLPYERLHPGSAGLEQFQRDLR